MMKTGRPRTCECGSCDKCKRRDRHRERWQAMTGEERAAVIARRDPEKVKAADRNRYYRHREDRLARMRAHRQQNPASYVVAAESWAARNPEKRKAQIAVSNAVRDGRLVRQPCETCGVTGKNERGVSVVHAHHDDYSKPLDVRWLCTRCHGAQHRRYAA